MAITRHTLSHLAELARIELTAHEAEKLLADLEKILEHFEELKMLDTTNVAPTRPPSTSSKAKSDEVNGGTLLVNSFREDTDRESTLQGKGADAFPETQDGFLKVPPVFE